MAAAPQVERGILHCRSEQGFHERQRDDGLAAGSVVVRPKAGGQAGATATNTYSTLALMLYDRTSTDTFLDRFWRLVERTNEPLPWWERPQLLNVGMGGWLTPPHHPCRSFSVGGRRGTERMSLTYALSCKNVPDDVKENIRLLLSEWEKVRLPFEHPDVQQWVKDVRDVRLIRSFYPAVQP